MTTTSLVAEPALGLWSTQLAEPWVFVRTLTHAQLWLRWSTLLLACAALIGCGERGSIPPPTIVETSPTSGATLVPNTAAVSAVFDHAMDPAGLTAESFTITCPDVDGVAARREL